LSRPPAPTLFPYTTLFRSDHGLWWAPDPASKDICTVGGNIATNAGGLLCAKYGVTRESVLALKVVLADGTLLSVGHRTVKGVTGDRKSTRLNSSHVKISYA